MMQRDGSPASFFGVLGSKSCYTGANSVIRMKHENRPHASLAPYKLEHFSPLEKRFSARLYLIISSIYIVKNLLMSFLGGRDEHL
jgi:hypothetical protein